MGVDIITVRLRDYKGDSASVNYFVQQGYLVADLDSYIFAITEYLDDITGAMITGVELTTQYPVWGPAKVIPVDGEDLERGVNFGYAVDGVNIRHTIRVPALLSAIGDGELVDPTTVPQSIYNAGVTGRGTTVQACNRSGVALTENGVIDPALITFHKAIK